MIRIVKWINDKLIKITRWVYNVPLGNGYKLTHRRNEMRNIKNEIRLHKMHTNTDKRFIDQYKNELKSLKTKSYYDIEDEKRFKQSLLNKKKRREGLQ